MVNKIWSVLMAMILVVSVMGCMKAQPVEAPAAPEQATEEAAPAAAEAPVATPDAHAK